MSPKFAIARQFDVGENANDIGDKPPLDCGVPVGVTLHELGSEQKVLTVLLAKLVTARHILPLGSMRE
jgi:hypothetical protein